jgi:hypothetical protein
LRLRRGRRKTHPDGKCRETFCLTGFVDRNSACALRFASRVSVDSVHSDTVRYLSGRIATSMIDLAVRI